MTRTSFFSRLGAALSGAAILPFVQLAPRAEPAIERTFVGGTLTSSGAALEGVGPSLARHGGGWNVVYADGARGLIAGSPLTVETLQGFENRLAVVAVEARDAGGAVREIFDLTRGIYTR